MQQHHDTQMHPEWDQLILATCSQLLALQLEASTQPSWLLSPAEEQSQGNKIITMRLKPISSQSQDKKISTCARQTLFSRN
jgi:hypothetical protein